MSTLSVQPYKSSPILFKHQEIKQCLGCAIQSIDEKHFGIDKHHDQIIKRIKHMLSNNEITDYIWRSHPYHVPFKKVCVVTHTPNHSDCYNYRIEHEMNILKLPEVFDVYLDISN